MAKDILKHDDKPKEEKAHASLSVPPKVPSISIAESKEPTKGNRPAWSLTETAAEVNYEAWDDEFY